MIWLSPHSRPVLGLGVVLLALSACTDLPTAPPAPPGAEVLYSAIDGAPLDAQAVRWLERRAQGCMFAVSRRDRQLQQIAVEREDLPFALPLVVQRPGLQGAPGRVARLQLSLKTKRIGVGVSCIVPSDYTDEQLVRAVERSLSNRTSWMAVLRGLAKATPRAATAPRYALEAREIRRLVLGVSPADLSRRPRRSADNPSASLAGDSITILRNVVTTAEPPEFDMDGYFNENYGSQEAQFSDGSGNDYYGSAVEPSSGSTCPECLQYIPSPTPYVHPQYNECPGGIGICRMPPSAEEQARIDEEVRRLKGLGDDRCKQLGHALGLYSSLGRITMRNSAYNYTTAAGQHTVWGKFIPTGAVWTMLDADGGVYNGGFWASPGDATWTFEEILRHEASHGLQQRLSDGGFYNYPDSAEGLPPGALTAYQITELCK